MVQYQKSVSVLLQAGDVALLYQKVILSASVAEFKWIKGEWQRKTDT